MRRRQAGKLFRVFDDAFGDVLADRHRNLIFLIENDDITIGEAERAHLRAAHVAVHRLLPDAFQMGGGALGAALGTELGHKGVAQVAAVHELHHPGRSGQRGHFHALELEGNGIADCSAGHRHGLGDFMAALEFRRDHRPPATGRRAGNDGAAVFHRAGHFQAGTDKAAGKGVDPHHVLGHGGFQG